MFIITFLLLEVIVCFAFLFWNLRANTSQIINSVGFLLSYAFFSFIAGWTQDFYDYLPIGFLVPFFIFFLFGVSYTLLKKFIWKAQLSLINQALFLFGTMFLGAVLWMSFGWIFYDYVPVESYPLSFATIGFMIPQFLHGFWQNISKKDIPTWQPTKKGIPVLEVSNYIPVTFIIPKHYKSNLSFKITVRAPIDQPIYKVFHYLLVQLEKRDKDNYPVLSDIGNSPTEWCFYLKCQQWWQSNRLLDFHNNLVGNNIINQPNPIILATRILPTNATTIEMPTQGIDRSTKVSRNEGDSVATYAPISSN